MDDLLCAVLRSRSLTEGQSERFFHAVFEGDLAPAVIKAALLLLARKGENAAELAGCVRALRRLEPARKTPFRPLLDTCGTGGDSSASINASTLAAFVIAGAGVKVAKHGNRAISSRCGSSDLMEALGVKINAPPRVMMRALKSAGIAYFHAPFYHPVFARVQPIRKALGTRTIFNLLGPLVNPLRVNVQLLGVSKPEHLGLFAGVIRRLKGARVLLCHSDDGMDEISPLVKTRLVWVFSGKIRRITLNPARYRFRDSARKRNAVSSKGGDRAHNARLALDILSGRETGLARRMVVLNAAAGLMVSGRSPAFQQAIRLAEDTLESGRAKGVLDRLIAVTRGPEN